MPKSGEGFIDFIGQVHKTKEQFGQEGPISVHCRWTQFLVLLAGKIFITCSKIFHNIRVGGAQQRPPPRSGGGRYRIFLCGGKICRKHLILQQSEERVTPLYLVLCRKSLRSLVQIFKWALTSPQYSQIRVSNLLLVSWVGKKIGVFDGGWIKYRCRKMTNSENLVIKWLAPNNKKKIRPWPQPLHEACSTLL